MKGLICAWLLIAVSILNWAEADENKLKRVMSRSMATYIDELIAQNLEEYPELEGSEFGRYLELEKRHGMKKREFGQNPWRLPSTFDNPFYRKDW